MNKISLEPLLSDIRQTRYSFKWIPFCHILKELNGEADALSKEALSLLDG